MGGEGSMLHMIKSLQYNNGLRRKQNPFEKDWGAGAAIRNALEKAAYASKHKKQWKNAPPKTKPLIDTGPDGANIFALFMVTLAALIGVGYFGVYRSLHFEPAPLPVQERSAAELKKAAEQYAYFTAAGDRWMEEEHWSNAIFEFKKALEYFPGDFAARERLAMALTYQCETSTETCKEALALLHALIEEQPDAENLYYLRGMCYLLLGEDGAGQADFAKAEALEKKPAQPKPSP